MKTVQRHSTFVEDEVYKLLKIANAEWTASVSTGWLLRHTAPKRWDARISLPSMPRSRGI